MSRSETLADESTNRMQSPVGRNAQWMKSYMETLINPFSTSLKTFKILDGEIKNTASLKLRATGELACNISGNTNIILFPGLTNVICYCTAPTGVQPELPADVNIDGTVFKKHLSTITDRSIVRVARLTGAGLRLFLTNSAEEDDGYWEACRITSHQASYDFIFKNDFTGSSLGAGITKVTALDFDLANNPTYQFGQLRDIHKYVFKLNSEDNEHKFSSISGINPMVSQDTYGNTPTPIIAGSALTDLDQWDMVFLKIRGRRNSASPSVLRFDSVANQEVVYAEDSPLARLMDETPRDPNVDGYLTYSRVDLPAFQAL